MATQTEKYRGYTLTATRDQTLGGWENTFLEAVRDDGLRLIDDFTEGEDPLDVLIDAMKRRVDSAIATNGASELMEDSMEDSFEQDDYTIR